MTESGSRVGVADRFGSFSRYPDLDGVIGAVREVRSDETGRVTEVLVEVDDLVRPHLRGRRWWISRGYYRRHPGHEPAPNMGSFLAG